MVTNFTATEIGDYLYARLQEPYTDIIRITNWSILAGINSPNTIGTLTVSNGNQVMVGVNTNINMANGDKFIVGSKEFTVDSVTGQNITVQEVPDFDAIDANFYLSPTANNYFSYSFRWSQEDISSDGGQMSELRPLNTSLASRDILGLVLDPTKPLWIDVKADVMALSSLYSISLLSVTFELETQTGTIQSCPQICNDCTDPYLIGCTNIVVDCVDPIYDPYNLSKPTAIYRQLSELSTNMWGHEVKYFKVEPDNRSRDVVLMEYSLYNVAAQGQLKIMVPDNEMPTQDFQFDIFGMGWEDFEVHITKGQMEAAFGIGKPPRARDYLYFPLMNRMYEVASVAFADEFNMEMSYWRVMLRKYEERTSTIVDDSAIQNEMDNLTQGIEEVFGEELKEEYDKTTKPEQYQTVFSPVGDGIRERIHNSLTIEDTELRNKWTVISKNNYDLSSIQDQGLEALVYKESSELSTSDSLAITAWFQPNFTDNIEQTIIDGRTINKGLKITVNQTSIKVYLNGDIQTYDFDVNPQNGHWYGLVFNLNNKFKSIEAYVYKLNSASNRHPNMPITESIKQVLYKNTDLASPEGWVAGKQWSLMPANMKMTNIRLFKKTIGQDQHRNILQQYIVRDNHLAKIIDNAIPSIQLRRYNQSR
jgi:hypothetical protein